MNAATHAASTSDETVAKAADDDVRNELRVRAH
jgi:hypothetical protein